MIWGWVAASNQQGTQVITAYNYDTPSRSVPTGTASYCLVVFSMLITSTTRSALSGGGS